MEELFFTYEGQQYSFNWRRWYGVDRYFQDVNIPDDHELYDLIGGSYRIEEDEEGVLHYGEFSNPIPEQRLVRAAIAKAILEHMGR
jgi:hypothetical protein